MKKKVLIILTCIIATMLLASCGAKQPEGNDSEATETLGDVEDTQADTPNTEGTPDTPSTEVTTPDTPSTEGTDTPVVTPQPQAPTYTYTELNKTMYAKSSVNVRDLPSTDGTKIGSLSKGQAVTVTGQCNETKWYRINLNGTTAYVSNSYLVDTKPVDNTPSTPNQPDTPSGGGGSTSNGNEIDMGNGYTIDVSDEDANLALEHNKEMAKAGLYTPVWDAERNRYYMLIKRTDNRMQWSAWLRNYIEERGGVSGVGGGNNSGVSLNGEMLYQIYVEVES